MQFSDRQEMAIRFLPGPKTLLLCDYCMGGFRMPEMVKRRPAVVVSPRLPYRNGLCSVVPISLTAPERDVPYVVKLEFAELLPAPFDSPLGWAKCDMIATVSLERLDLFRTGRDYEGKRKYLTRKISDADSSE
jgi:uncharacterized protein YifN (PemK superfamily)